MIDEDLYQLAVEELNSERRRPRLWARACSLAGDDHDEARYLYTNLRVEELLAERAAGKTPGSTPESSIGSRADELALEPLEGESEGPGASDDAAPASVRAGAATVSEPLPSMPRGTDATDYPESVRGEPQLELDTVPSFDVELGELARADAGTDDVASEAAAERASGTVTGAGGSAGFDRDAARTRAEADGAIPAAGDARESEAAATGDWLEETLPEENGDTIETAPAAIPAASRPTPSTPSVSVDDLEWLDEGIRDGEHGGEDGRSGVRAATDDVFARELARQADELPGRERPTVITQGSPSTDAGVTRAGAVATTTAELVPAAPRAPQRDAPEARGHDGEPPEPDESVPLELDDDEDPETGTEHAVFVAPDGTARTVRQGNSWSALLFTLPWLLRHGLVGTAIVYALFAVVVLVGLALTAVAWAESGANASLATRAATVAFTALALLGLLWVPLRYANGWREDKLERRGYTLAAYVRARRPERAIALAREARAHRRGRV